MEEYNNLLDTFTKNLKSHKGTRWASLATINKDNSPNVRNIIIRDYSNGKIIIYTHGLSQKIEDINLNPNTSLCWYSHRNSIQIQFYGKSYKLEDSTPYKINIKNFKDYIGGKPGSDIESIEDNQANHFSVIELKIEKVVALKLSKNGHKKYVCEIEKDHVYEVLP